MFYVYEHSTPSGQLFYVGKGAGRRAFLGAGRSERWNRKVSKHGGYNVRFVFHGTEQECFDEEVRLIALYRSQGVDLVNHCDGGEGRGGWHHTAEARQKLRVSHLGLRGRVGFKASAETRAKQRVASTGQRHSPEARAKIAAAKVGVPRSEATKQKIRDGLAARRAKAAVCRTDKVSSEAICEDAPMR